MPDVNNENLKKYIIDVDVNIKQAEEKLATLQSSLDKGIESGKIKKTAKSTVSDLVEEFTRLEKEVKASISNIEDSIKNGFKGINTKEVATQFKFLSDQIEGFQGQIETLQNVLDKSDTAKFEKAITKMISPFSKLDDTIKEMRQTLESLVEPIQTISSVMVSGISVGAKEIGKATQETAKAVKKANKEVVAVSEETAREIKNVYKQQLTDIMKPITNVLSKEKGKTFTQYINNISKSADKTKLESVLRLLSELDEQINIIKQDATSKGIAVNVSNLFKGTPFTESNIQKAQEKLNRVLSRSLVKSTSPNHKIKAAIDIEGTIDDVNINNLVDQIRDEVINKIADKLSKSDDNRSKVKLPVRIDTVGLKGEVDRAIKKVNQELRDVNSQFQIDIPIRPFISPQNLEKVGGEIQEQILNEGGVNLNTNNVLKLGDIGNLATEKTVEDIRNILQGMLGKAVIKTVNGEIVVGGKTQNVNSTNEKDVKLSEGFKDYLYNLRRNINSTYAKRFGVLEDAGAIREVASQAEKDYQKLIKSIKDKFLSNKDVNPIEYLKGLEIYNATQGTEEDPEKYAKFGNGETAEAWKESLEKNTKILIDGIEESLSETKSRFEALKKSGLTDEVKDVALKELSKQKDLALSNTNIEKYINKHNEEINQLLKERNKSQLERIQILKQEEEELSKPIKEIFKERKQNISLESITNNYEPIKEIDTKIKELTSSIKEIDEKVYITDKKTGYKVVNPLYRKEIKEYDKQLNDLRNEEEILKQKRTELLNSMSKTDLDLYNQTKEYLDNIENITAERKKLENSIVNSRAIAIEQISTPFQKQRNTIEKSTSINKTISSLLSDALKRETEGIVDTAIKDASNLLNTERIRQKGRVKFAESIANYGKDAVLGKTSEEQYKRDLSKMKPTDTLPYLLNAERLDDIDFTKLGKKFNDQFVAEVGEELPSVVKNTLEGIKAEGQEKIDKLTSNVEDLQKEKNVLEEIVRLRKEDKDNTEEISKLVASEIFQLNGTKSFDNNESLDKYVAQRLPEINEFLDEAENAQKVIYGYYNNLQRRFAESIYDPISWDKQYKAKVNQYNENIEELRYLNQLNRSDLTPYERERLSKLQKSVPILKAQLAAYEEINKDEEEVQEETKRRTELTKNTKFANRAYTKAGNQAAIRLSNIEGRKYSLDKEEGKIRRFENLSNDDLTNRIKDSDLVIKELDKEYSKVEDSIDKVVDKKLKEIINSRIKYLENRKEELVSKINKNKKYVEDNNGTYRPGKLDSEVERIDKSLNALKNNESISVKNINRQREELASIESDIFNWEEGIKQLFGITTEAQIEEFNTLKERLHSQDAARKIIISQINNVIDDSLKLKKGLRTSDKTKKKILSDIQDFVNKNKLNIDPSKIDKNDLMKYLESLERRDQIKENLEHLNYLTDEKGNGISYIEKAKQSAIKLVTKEKEELEKERNTQLEINNALKEEQTRRARVQKQAEATAKIRKKESKMDIDAEIAKSEQSYETEKKAIQNKYGKASTLKGKITRTENTVEKLQKQYDKTEKEIDDKYAKLFEAVNKKIEKAKNYKDPNLSNIETALRKRNTALKKTTDENERKQLEEDISKITQDRDILRYKFNKKQTKMAESANAENQALKQQLASEKEERLDKIEKQLSAKRTELTKLEEQQREIDSEIRTLDKQHQAELENLEAIRERNKEAKNEISTENQSNQVKAKTVKLSEDEAAQKRLAAIEAEKQAEEAFELLSLKEKILYLEKKIAKTTNSEEKTKLNNKLLRYNKEFVDQLNAEEYKERMAENALEVEIPKRKKRTIKATSSEDSKEVKEGDTTTLQVKPIEEFEPGALATEATLREILNVIKGKSIKGDGGDGNGDEFISQEEFEILKQAVNSTANALQNKITSMMNDETSQQKSNKKESNASKESAKDVENAEKKKQSAKKKTQVESKQTQQEEKKEGQVAKETAKDIKQTEDTKQYARELYNNVKSEVGKYFSKQRHSQAEKDVLGNLLVDFKSHFVGNKDLDIAKIVKDSGVDNSKIKVLTDLYKRASNAKEVKDAESKKQTAKKETIKVSEKVKEAEKQEGKIAEETAKKVIESEKEKQKVIQSSAVKEVPRSDKLSAQELSDSFKDLLKDVDELSKSAEMQEEFKKLGLDDIMPPEDVRNRVVEFNDAASKRKDLLIDYSSDIGDAYSEAFANIRNEYKQGLIPTLDEALNKLQNKIQELKKTNSKNSEQSKQIEEKEVKVTEETTKKKIQGEKKVQREKKKTKEISEEIIESEKKESTAAIESAKEKEKAENTKQKTVKKVTRKVRKQKVEKDTENLKNIPIDNILKRFLELDNAIVESTNSFDKLLERQFVWNSKTGTHSNFNNIGNNKEVHSNYFKGADSFLHTHPEDYAIMSSNEDGKGDFRSFYQAWKVGIKNQFIRGLKETLYFDADQFFSDLKAYYDKTGIKFDDTAFEKINLEWGDIWRSLTAKLTNFNDLYSKIQLSKESFIDFLNQISKDSDLLTKIFGSEINDKSLLDNVKNNISNMENPINSIIDYFKKGFSDDILESLYGDNKTNGAIMFGKLNDELRKYGMTNGFGKGIDDYETQKKRILGKHYSEIESDIVNTFIKRFNLNKSASDYFKRYDNPTFDSKIWEKFIPDTSKLNKESKNKGKEVSESFAKGVKDGSKEVGDSGKKVADTLVDVTKDKLKEHSPSETARQIGLYYVQGLALGIEGGIPLLVDSIKQALEAGQITKEDVDKLFTHVSNYSDRTDLIFGSIKNDSQLKGIAQDLSHANLFKAIGFSDIDIDAEFNKIAKVYKDRNKYLADLNRADFGGYAQNTLNEYLAEAETIIERFNKQFGAFLSQSQLDKIADFDKQKQILQDFGLDKDVDKTLSDKINEYRKLRKDFKEAMETVISNPNNLNDKQIELLGDGDNGYAKRKAELEGWLNAFREISEYTSKINLELEETAKLETQLAKEAQNYVDTNQNKGAEELYKNLTRSIDDIVKLFSQQGDLTDEQIIKLKAYAEAWENATNSIGEFSIVDGGNTKTRDNALKAQQKFNEEGWLSYIDKARREINNIGDSLQNILSNSGKYTVGFIQQVSDVFNKVKNIDLKTFDVHSFDDLEKLSSMIGQIKLESQDIFNAKQNNEALAANIRSIEKYRGKVAKILNENTRMASELREQFLKLQNELDSFDPLTGTREQALELTTTFEHLNAELIKSGKLGLNIFDRFKKELANTNARLIAQYLSFYDIIRYARQIVSTINELDTALVDLRKTTSMTATELDEFYFSSNKIAKQMGVTTQEIIQQAANWSRLGYSTKEASEQMAALSSQFAAISPGMDVSTATDGLVSAMKAFHVEVDNVESEIMDPVNRLGNTMATTNEEIVEMLERSSAAMYAANNSIEETLALESAAVQITRNAESTGTAFRTISMRIRGYDEETEELSEEYENLSGKIADLTKTAKSPGGISLFTDKDKQTFKSTYQLLKDISEIWDELSDKQQAQLLEKLAGKRGGQVLAGILGKENFAEVERAMGEIAQAAGSADAEMDIIRDSVAFKLNELKETWIGYAQELLQRDDIGKIVDKLIEGSESLQTTIDVLTPVVSTFINLLSQLIGILADLSEATNGWAIPAIAGGIGSFKLLDKVDTTAFDARAEKIGGFFSSIKEWYDNIGNDIPDPFSDSSKNTDFGEFSRWGDGFEDFEDTTDKVKEGIENIGDALEETGGNGDAVLTALKNKLKQVGAILTSPTFWGIAAITAAIYAIYKFSTAQSEMLKRVNEATKAREEESKALEEYRTKALELQGIANDNTKSLEEQQQAREDLLELQDTMIEQFGKEAGQIDILTDSVTRLNDAFDYLNEHAYQEYINKVNDNSWDSDLSLGENISRLITDEAMMNSGSSNLQEIKKMIEHQFVGGDIIGSDFFRVIKEDLKNAGVDNLDIINPVTGGQGDLNALQYYEALLDILPKYENKTDETSKKITSILTKEANRLQKLLYDEEEGIYKTYSINLEHDVIDKYYSEDVEKIKDLKKQLRKAQVKDDKEAVDSLTKQLYEAYNGVLDKAGSDESVKQWFGDFVTDVQKLLDEEEFRLKVHPEVPTDESEWFERTKRRIAESDNEHLYDDEVYRLANSELSTRDIEKQYGTVVADVISYIREQVKQGVPIDLVIDELEIPNHVIRNLGKDFEIAFNKLSSEDQGIISAFSEKEIKDEMSMIKNTMPNIKDGAELAEKAIESLIRKSRELAKEIEEITFENTINTLSDLEGQIGNVDNAMSKFFDDEDGNVELSDIKAIQDAFAEIEGFNVDDVADDLNSLISAGNYDEAADSIDRLVSKYIEASGILDTVNNKNKDLIATQLNLMGITNAQEIVEASLNERSALLAAENEYLAETGENVAEATYEEIYQFINLQNASEQTEKYLAQVAIEKISINDNKINTASDCQQLLNLANTAMASAEAISTVKEAQAAIASNSITRQDWGQSVLNKINNGTFDWGFSKNKIELDDVSVPMAKYEGGKATKSAKDASSKGSEASKETFDWIETKIQRLERDITNLGKTADATYKTWAERTVALGQEIGKVNEQIKLQESAYNAYMTKAESVGLSAQYKSLVQNGGLKIDEITDDKLKEQIQSYQEWYEKALDAKDKIDDLKDSLANLAKAKFDNISTQFEDLLSDIEHVNKYIDAQLKSVETMGKIAGKSFYQAQIEQQRQQANDLNAELVQLQTALNEGLASGTIEYGSQMFNEMKKTIYGVEEQIWDCNTAILEFEQNMKQVAKQNFDDLLSQYDNAISILTSKMDLTDNIVSMVESTGHVVSQRYYEALSEGAEANVNNLEKKYKEMSQVFADAVANGDVKEYSEDWYAMKDSVESVKSEIISATQQLIEYKKAMRQIDWDLFDRGQTRLEQLNSEAEFFINLYSRYPLFDKETGDITDLGITTRGLYVQEYEVLANSVKQYADEIARLKQEISEDPGNTELIDRLRDLEEQQRSNISAMEDQKEALRDLAEEGYNALLDALQKLIDKYKDALQQQKSLYDYEKNISEQNANINSLRKQLLAYDNGRDTTEENKARVQKLNADLKKAEEQLQESEYDRWIQDTEALLDKFMDDFQTWIEQKLLDLDVILREAIEATNLNAETISNTLNTTSDKTGYVLTDEFAKIWANIMSSDSIFSQSFDIESATNQVCTDIKAGVDLLPTMDGLSNYLSGETLSIVNSIASVDNAVGGVQSAIGETNSALAQISSKLTEYNAGIKSSIASAQQAAQQAKQAAQQAQNTANQAKSEASAAKSAAQKASTNTSTSSLNGNRIKYVYRGHEYTSHAEAYSKQAADAQQYSRSIPHSGNNGQKYYYNEWLRDYPVEIVRYAKGGRISDKDNPLDLIAQSLGEDHMVAAKEGERILTAKQNENFEKLANVFSSLSSEDMAKYSILTGNKMIGKMPTLQMPTFREFGQSNGGTEINGGISINLPNVTNKEEFVNWLKTDGQIEKIVQSMTLGKLQGKNSYDKMKY